MNILQAARDYFGVPKGQDIIAYLGGPFVPCAFFAGAAFGALGARMTQEEILKTVREAAAPPPLDPAWRALFAAAKAVSNERGVRPDSEPIMELRRALAKVPPV